MVIHCGFRHQSICVAAQLLQHCADDLCGLIRNSKSKMIMARSSRFDCFACSFSFDKVSPYSHETDARQANVFLRAEEKQSDSP